MLISEVLTSMTLVLMIGGIVAALRAIRRAIGEMRRAPRDPERAFALICGFRRAMFGCCVTALGIGLYCESPAIIGLALIICAEETLESSTVIAALKHDWAQSRCPICVSRGIGSPALLR